MPHYMLVIRMSSLLSEICWEEIVWWLFLTACLITIILVNIIHKAANYTWNRFFLSCGWYVTLWCSGWISSKFFTHHGTFLALQCIKQVLHLRIGSKVQLLTTENTIPHSIENRLWLFTKNINHDTQQVDIFLCTGFFV